MKRSYRHALDRLDSFIAAGYTGVGMDVRLAETTYCMSKGSHLLRLILRPSGFSIRLNDTQPFGEKKYIARSNRHSGRQRSYDPAAYRLACFRGRL